MNNAQVCRVSLVAALAMLCGACLNFPRDGQVVASKSTAVSFEGYYWNASGVEIKAFVKNNNNGVFEQITHAPILTGTTPYVDNAGDTWFFFQASDVVIPGDAKYWSAGSGRTILARVKVIGPGNQEIVSFDTGSATDTCINTQLQTGGAAVMTNCKSALSPAVRLVVNCGTANADCCLSGAACDTGKNCAAGLCTASCGAQAQPCCNAAPACSSGNVCLGGSCAVCKAKGTACGSSAECCNGLGCTGGVCKPPCSPGAACSVSGKQGACAAGQTNCAGLDPVCQQVVFPQSDTNCNGVDEDCDGTADDNYASHACAKAPSGCQGGFSVTGSSHCSGGAETCTAQNGVDYCTSCGSAACGECGATPCTPGVTKCTPGYVCKTGATLGCGVTDSSTACWPIDGAHCSGCGAACWKPSNVTVAGTCP